MFGSGKSFLGGLIGLFFFSIAVFFLIYFFVPEVSVRFFGISASADEIIDGAIAEAVESSGLPAEISAEIGAYLSSEEGQAFLSETGENLDGLSERLSALVSDAGTYIASGKGSASDYFQSGEEGV